MPGIETPSFLTDTAERNGPAGTFHVGHHPAGSASILVSTPSPRIAKAKHPRARSTWNTFRLKEPSSTNPVLPARNQLPSSLGMAEARSTWNTFRRDGLPGPPPPSFRRQGLSLPPLRPRRLTRRSFPGTFHVEHVPAGRAARTTGLTRLPLPGIEPPCRSTREGSRGGASRTRSTWNTFRRDCCQPHRLALLPLPGIEPPFRSTREGSRRVASRARSTWNTSWPGQSLRVPFSLLPGTLS